MTGLTRRDAVKLGLAAGAAAALPSAGSAAADGEVTVTFLLTNDVYTMAEEKGRGGLARLAAVVKAERAKGRPVIFAHGGDTFSPSLMSGFDQGAHMVALFNAIGLDAFVPGNHEFDFGKEVYLQRIEETRFPVLAANLRGPDGAVLPKHRDTMIVEAGPVHIGIVGAALEATPILSSPGDLRFTSATDAVRDGAAALRAAGADFTVALVHTNRDEDYRMFDAGLVDLILTGHDHDLRIDYFGRTAMAESGSDAVDIVAIDVAMTLKTDGGKRSVSWRPRFRIIDSASVTPDPDILAMVKGYEKELDASLDVPLATLAAPLDSRTTVVRTQGTAIGDLIADAMRAAQKADVAITNGGGIRGNKLYPAGTVFTRRDVLTELPFGNKTVSVPVSGAMLRKALEHGFDQLPEPSGRFPQVSGLAVTIDPGKPKGERVVSILVGGEPLDDARAYRLATNDFMLRGGDGYVMLRPDGNLVDEGDALMANDVMVYLRRLGTVDAPASPRIVQR
jgi:2',3'-cyclic-nucleotide 2'-phosphodiesterase (5'-nucleotidase family)